jgi:hypothetical protein
MNMQGHPQRQRTLGGAYTALPFLTVLLWIVSVFPEQGGAQSIELGREAASPKAAPRITKIGPDVYQCGKVRLDAAKRCLRFPATVNRWDGPLEYALVTSLGAKHESLLLTDVDPLDIHTAAVLLGGSAPILQPPGDGTPAPPGDGTPAPSSDGTPAPPSADAPVPQGGTAPSPLDSQSLQSAPAPVGKPIQIWIEFEKDHTPRRVRLESWLEADSEGNTPEKIRIPDTHWLYTGSYLFNGQFAAQEEGNLIALVISAAALVNNPLPQNRNDRIWGPRAEGIPAAGTVVEIEFLFEPPKRRTP